MLKSKVHILLVAVTMGLSTFVFAQSAPKQPDAELRTAMQKWCQGQFLLRKNGVSFT